MIAQLTVLGNQIVATVSNGTAPFGIIDDIKSKAFSAVSWDETVEVLATGVPGPGSTIITTADIKVELRNANINPDSFISIPVPVQLIPRNGVIVFPAGTILNFDKLGMGSPNAIKTNVRYSYLIPNVIGDDSTAGSHRMTIWFQRGIFATDSFDTAATYPLNANLFVGLDGKLTTKQSSANIPSIAITTAPPSPVGQSMLEFLLL